MARKLREWIAEQYFHVIYQSNNHIFLFHQSNDFQKYLMLVHHYFKKYSIQCFHYCLMNTHVHFIIKLPEKIEKISHMMKIISLKYCHYYKLKYNYEGNLWRSRYKNEFIDTDRYMLGCGLYVEYNPVKAGMVKKPEDYAWSSYRHWIREKEDKLLSDHPLDEVIKNYKNIAEDYIEVYNNYIKLSKVSLGRQSESY